MNHKPRTGDTQPTVPDPTPVLVWFRNDLRTVDHSALWNAAQKGPVVACYFITPEQWRRHDMAACRVNFLLRTLKVLRTDLKTLGMPLIVEQVPDFAQVPKVLLRLARTHNCKQVYWNDEYPIDEQRRDLACEKALAKHAIQVYRFHDTLVAPPGSVTRNDGGPFKVFTPFKKAWLRLLEQRLPEVLPAPEPQPWRVHRLGAIPSSLPGFAGEPSFRALWLAGQAEAQRRLRVFAGQALLVYDQKRDFPAVEGTSQLSPYLAVGAISPRQCLLTCLSANRGEFDSGNQGARTWLNELIWREFYQHIVVAFPHVCMNKPFLLNTERVRWRTANSDFRQWCEGRTGVPIVDAGMRQLLQTGWMHNRVRMIVAMFLSKNLLIDWRRGERFFMQHLIDGDFAANNGGWQWSASTGTDAAPYFRVFNPFSQAARFDADGQYIYRYVPELRTVEASYLHDPAKLAANRSANYPPLMVDLKSSRLNAIEAFKNI